MPLPSLHACHACFLQARLVSPHLWHRRFLAPRPACASEQLRLFDGGVDLEAMRMERAHLAEARRSANTRRAYAADWRDFAAWCEAAGRRPLSATADAVCLYLVDLARSGRLMSTVARRCQMNCRTEARRQCESDAGRPRREFPKGLYVMTGDRLWRLAYFWTCASLALLHAGCALRINHYVNSRRGWPPYA